MSERYSTPDAGVRWLRPSEAGGTRSGAFDSVSLPDGCVLLQSGTTVTIYFPCLSDLDADADADSDDVIGSFERWEGGDLAADIDNDNDDDTDSDDILAYFAAFDAGC